MNKKQWQIIAKHFAKSINCVVNFQENATPSTNGKEIILPLKMSNDYIDIILGGLLHETAHIRYSNFNTLRKCQNKAEQVSLNTLEDIRIEFEILKEYKNAILFLKRLINDCINRNKEELKKENFPIQILKSIYLKAHKIDISKIYEQATIEAFPKFEKYIEIAKGAKNTEELFPHAQQLAKDLFKELEKQQKQNPQDSAMQQLTENQKEIEKLEKETGKAKESLEKASQNLKEYKSAKRKRKLNTTKKRKLGNEKYKCENAQRNAIADANQKGVDSEQKKIDQLKKKIEEKEKRVNEETKKENEALQKWNNGNRSEFYQKQRELREAQRNENYKKQDAHSSIQKCFDNGQALNGFEAMDNEAMKKAIEQASMTEPNLEQLIIDALVIKEEIKQQNDEANEINTDNFCELYTEPEMIFEETTLEQEKTHITFFVDASGSMSFAQKSGGYSGSICLSALNTICEAVQEAIKKGSCVDFSIHAFGTDTGEIMNNANYNENDLIEKYNKFQRRFGSYTFLTRCLNKVLNELKNTNPNDKNIILVITDANVNDTQLKQLRNELNRGDTKIIYIAVNANLRSNDAITLFGDNNITDIDNAKEIIANVMLEHARQ